MFCTLREMLSFHKGIDSHSFWTELIRVTVNDFNVSKIWHVRNLNLKKKKKTWLFLYANNHLRSY